MLTMDIGQSALNGSSTVHVSNIHRAQSAMQGSSTVHVSNGHRAVSNEG
jgi:hypothetical protein